MKMKHLVQILFKYSLSNTTLNYLISLKNSCALVFLWFPMIRPLIFRAVKYPILRSTEPVFQVAIQRQSIDLYSLTWQ